MRSVLTIACALVVLGSTGHASDRNDERWIGTWATAAQPARPSPVQTFRNQTLRLIVHTSVAGTKVRIKVSNTFGDRPLAIGNAHIARRSSGADIDPASDRALTFRGRPAATIPARSIVVSDPVDLAVPALSDLAISLFFPQTTAATTSHSLALQTNYVSAEAGDATADAKFPIAKTITFWPFLTGVDVASSSRGATIVAFGSSTTDGDGSTRDANQRWPDVLAARFQQSRQHAELGVLNEGIIGNRLLFDSPRTATNPFGPSLGQAGVTRFDRDVLAQPGVRFVMLALGVNDILFPEFPFTPPNETVSADTIIAGYRRLIARAHDKGVRTIATTIPPFEGATFNAAGLNLSFYTPERDRARQAVNEWIRRSGTFDGVVDFDEVLRDPDRPTRLNPKYASDDHLHVNDAGNFAQGNAIPLTLFDGR